MTDRRVQTMTFVEEEPPLLDPVDHIPKCPKCGNPLDERHYPHLPDPKSYYDCPTCHLTWEGFLTAPTDDLCAVLPDGTETAKDGA